MESLKYGTAGAMMTIAACGGAVEKKAANPSTVILIPAVAEEKPKAQPAKVEHNHDRESDKVPATIEEFHEALVNCAIVLSGAEAMNEMLGRIEEKTCRTWQSIYDTARQSIQACLPVVLARDADFIKWDRKAKHDAQLISMQVRILSLQSEEFQLSHPKCFPVPDASRIHPQWTSHIKPMF